MLPGRWRTLLALMTPRRYSDPELIERFAPVLYGGRLAEQPHLIRPFARHMQPPSRRGYLLQQLALVRWTSLHWLWRLRQPTLIVAGTRDPIVHVANAKLMHRLIPRSRLELVDDGHLFLLTDRRAIATTLRFLIADDPLSDAEPVAGATFSAAAE